MIDWDIEDRKQLITLLRDLPELRTERSRLEILELAGLKQLVPMIDLSGTPFVAVSGIVTANCDRTRHKISEFFPDTDHNDGTNSKHYHQLSYRLPPRSLARDYQ
jgi:hypothetical protein